MGGFGVCTGRSLTGVKKSELSPLLSFDFYILDSGALILDRDLSVIHKSCIPRSVMEEIHTQYRGKVPVVIHANDTVYNFEHSYSSQTHISSMNDIEGDSIYGLSFGTTNPQEAERIAEEINAVYGDILWAYVNVKNVDMVSRDCSKGVAVGLVKAHLKAQLSGGIGDSFNDIPLLESVDRAYTFYRSPEPVREKAPGLVNTVAQALEDFQQQCP